MQSVGTTHESCHKDAWQPMLMTKQCEGNGRTLTDLRGDGESGCLMFSYPEFSSCSTALQREAII